MTNRPENQLKDYLELSKLKIMIPVSLTGFTGYFVFDPHFTARLLLTTFGILFMAISASVLNQIQEAVTDSKMNRTYNRPIPAGRIKIQQAWVFFILNLIAGMALIAYAGNLWALAVACVTVIWYNVIYTYSKRFTAFAVVPGAVTGALPPLIGWVAAGGGIWEKSIVFIEFLIFIGQIPHFWLLILKYGKEYELAGFPSLSAIFNQVQIRRLTFSWVTASVVAALFLCYFEIIHTVILNVILIAVSIFMLWQFTGLLSAKPEKNNYRIYSVFLDSYFLVVLLLLISDRIII